jgi:D-sedoheptulose 7-phosphate isomerase
MQAINQEIERMNRSLDYISDLQLVLNQLPIDLIEQIIHILHDARLKKRHVFIMGNGGSASTATHFACDLGKNTRLKGMPDFRAICLSDNMALMSAYANDEGYENVFSQQLSSLLQPGDIVIGISTSGNSPNVIKAIKLAIDTGARTIGFTGARGGQLGQLVDLNIFVPCDNIAQVEDVHLMLEHMICEALREIDSAPGVPNHIPTFYPNRSNDVIDAISISPAAPILENLPQNGGLTDIQSGSNLFNQILILSEEMNDSVNRIGLLPKILQLIMRNIGAISGCIFLFNEEGYVTETALAYIDKVEVYLSNRLTDILQGGLAGWVVENRQPVLVSNTLTDSRWLKRVWEEKNGSRSAISVPLMNSDKVIGVLTLVRAKAEEFSNHDLALLASLGVYISLAMLVPYHARINKADRE